PAELCAAKQNPRPDELPRRPSLALRESARRSQFQSLPAQRPFEDDWSIAGSAEDPSPKESGRQFRSRAAFCAHSPASLARRGPDETTTSSDRRSDRRKILLKSGADK